MITLGRVTSVFPDKTEGRVYVSVKASPSEQYNEILFATGQTGLWMVPSVGDIVEVYEVGYESYVARTPHNPAPFDMPPLSEGDFCLKLNANTELTFQQQGDGTFDLTVETDGAVNVTAPEVTIGSKDGTSKAVAREGDPVTVDPDTGDGSIDSGSSDVSST